MCNFYYKASISCKIVLQHTLVLVFISASVCFVFGGEGWSGGEQLLLNPNCYGGDMFPMNVLFFKVLLV